MLVPQSTPVLRIHVSSGQDFEIEAIIERLCGVPGITAPGGRCQERILLVPYHPEIISRDEVLQIVRGIIPSFEFLE